MFKEKNTTTISKPTSTNLVKNIPKQNNINAFFKPVSEKKHTVNVQKQFIINDEKQQKEVESSVARAQEKTQQAEERRLFLEERSKEIRAERITLKKVIEANNIDEGNRKIA